MSEINSRPFFSLNDKCAKQNFKKTYAILVYEHVDILRTYRRAKIAMMILA